MESVLNELSLINLANSRAEARDKMYQLLQLLKELNKFNFNRIRLPSSEFFGKYLSKDYTINEWLNDIEVNRNLKTLFMGLKSYPFFEELDKESEKRYIFSSQFLLNEPHHPENNKKVEGFVDAYFRNTLAVSFQSHHIWKKCSISILEKNGNEEEELFIIHASEINCLDENFDLWYKKRTRPPLNSHADVDFWFPPEDQIQLSNKSKDDLIHWYQENQMEKISKIESFFEEIKNTPFKGSGKVEPLKENLSGWWSRRINQEHRLVYKFESKFIYVCSCRGHYEGLTCN